MKTACIFAFAIAAAVTGCTTSHCDPNAPNTICTIAGHTLNEAYSGNGGPAIDADMYIPIDSAVAPDGTVWFIDFNNYVIRRIDDKGIIWDCPFDTFDVLHADIIEAEIIAAEQGAEEGKK